MKYEVGDKVRIKSLDWYYDNRDRIDEVACGNTNFIPDMTKYCGEIVTISSVLPTLEAYHIKEDGGMFNWTDEMIEGLVGNIIKCNDMNWINEFECPDGYEFRDENGNVINATKIVLEKKKPKYPTTLKECLEVIEYKGSYGTFGHQAVSLRTFQDLLICRDAYWKIAGDWKPDYVSGIDKFGITCYDGMVTKTSSVQHWERHLNKVLEFPTSEMRNAFYENFADLIYECKELL